MKKLFILLVICLTILTGCTSKEDQENEFVVAAKKYYENNMSGLIGVNEVDVKLEDILNDIDKGGIYNIPSISKCSSNSVVTFTLEDDKISSEKVVLDCKKN